MAHSLSTSDGRIVEPAMDRHLRFPSATQAAVLALGLYLGATQGPLLAQQDPFRRLPAIDLDVPTPASQEPTPALREPTPALREPTPALREPTPALRAIVLRRLPAVHPSELRRLPHVVPPPSTQRATTIVPHHVSHLLQRWAAAQGTLAGVAQRAALSIDRGQRLAERGALYSARSEFIQALRAISQALDAEHNTTHHTDSLLAGLEALSEAEDFVAEGSQLESPIDVGTVAATHRSGVLGSQDWDAIPAVIAMQRYFEFGQDSLAAATGGAPAGSKALFCLGKTYMAFAERSSAAERLNAPKAIAFHQAAVLVDPSNHLAANELGVLLARFGQLDAAREALEHSVAIQPVTETLHNLAVVYRKLGHDELAQQLPEPVALTAVPQGGESPGSPVQVRWVEPEAFVGPPLADANQTPTPATPPAAPRQARRARPTLQWPW